MPLLKRQFHFLNQTVNILIEAAQAAEIFEETEARLNLYQRRFSHDHHSELSLINQYAGIKAVTVEPQLFELIKLGQQHSLLTSSNLNIAIEPLIDTWQIGRPDAHIPTETEIATQLALTNPHQIILDQNQHAVLLAETGMSLTLTAIVKGYVTDLLTTYFQSVGVFSALIDFGGAITVLGPSRQIDQKWHLNLVDPLSDQNTIELSLTNKSIVKADVYKRALIKDDFAYSYILDKNDGYPIDPSVNNLTIVADSAADADIWKMRLLGKEPAEIIAQLNQLTNIDGLIFVDDDVLFSDGLANQVNRH